VSSVMTTLNYVCQVMVRVMVRVRVRVRVTVRVMVRVRVGATNSYHTLI
jgi:hypothetical protein